jgi:hypothetical protein
MPDRPRWTKDQMLRLAARGVLKVDLLGDRGTTLCSMDEIAAMAAVLALSDAIPADMLTPMTLTKGETT